MFFWFLILILKLISIKVSSGEIYLAKVSHIKQVEGVKQVTLLHGKHRVAWRQKCADVLQAQELQSWGLKKIKYWKSELKQYTSNIFCLRLGQTGVSHFQITGKVVCNKAGFFFLFAHPWFVLSFMWGQSVALSAVIAVTASAVTLPLYNWTNHLHGEQQ